MKSRLLFHCNTVCILVVIACLWFIPACSAAVSAEAFHEHYNLPGDPEPLLQRILATNEFKDQPVQTLLERIEEWGRDALEYAAKWILDRLPSIRLPSTGPIRLPHRSLYIIAGVILAAFLLLMIILVVRFLSSRTRSPRQNFIPLPPDPEEIDLLSSRDLLDLASRTAGQGQYSEAMVHIFRFVLSWLDEQGRLAFHPSKTNRELLASLTNGASFREILVEMIPVFDNVRYGGFQCDRTDYERFLVLSRRITGLS